MSTNVKIKNIKEDYVENNGKIEMSQYMNHKENHIEVDSVDEENTCNHFMKTNQVFMYYCRLIIINIIAIVYFAYATYVWITKKSDSGFDWCNGYGLLLLIYCFVYGRLFYEYVLKKFCCDPLYKVCLSCCRSFGYKKNSQLEEISVCVVILAAIIVFVVIDTNDSRSRLMGFVGVGTVMIIGWCMSKHPTKVSWKPVIWGLIIQFILAIISVRWTAGRSIIQCLSDKIVAFLNFSRDGAKLLFSEELVENDVFAFTVLPVIFFFSFVVQIMYYLGVMQYMIKKIGRILNFILGTTACESLHAATTLFLGMPESFLVIEPYLNKLTTSEVHAIMCSCFSTISGTVVAAYISYGAQPIHLVTAMVMSAPAGLCFSKLLYPETRKSSTHFKNIVLTKARETSFLDAATQGALSGIPLVLGIIANVVAFVSAVAFVNAILTWLGSLVGFSDLTFELILAKVFTPISYIIGVPWNECESVGTLIGLKTVVNELVAYKRLGEFKLAKKLSSRAEAIATHAICGFSNPGALGVMVGSLSTMAPEKKEAITATAMRAFMGGIAVCFLTGSIAGILITDDFELSKQSLHEMNTTSLHL